MAADLNGARSAMTAIRASLKRDVEAITRSDRYTDAGRRQELAKTVLAHRKQAKPLRDSFSVGNDDSRAKLTRRLFGLPDGADPASTLVYRDAVDRCAQLRSPEQLEGTLSRAVAMGDTLLARAAAGRAHELGVRSVVESYVETSGLDNDYDELRALPSSQLASAAVFGLPVPEQLLGVVGGVTDERLERIAAGDE